MNAPAEQHGMMTMMRQVDPAQMTHILDELRATAYSTVCPHGRPVMLRLTKREIEKNFERV